MAELGFRVAYWDLSSFLRPNYHAEHHPPDHILPDNARVFDSEKTALAALDSLPESSVVLSLLGYQARHRRFYRALSRDAIRYGVQQLNFAPRPPPEDESISARISTVARRGPRAWLNVLVGRLPASVFGIQPPDFYLAGGVRSLESGYPIGADTDIVWGHSMDYDCYLERRTEASAGSGTAVFLDEMVPHHPDYLDILGEPYAPPEVYYPALREGFDRVENHFDLEVVVASHPRADYGSDHPFGDRRVVRGRTADMVATSQIVLAHASTALNFAVLFERPVLLLTADFFRRSGFHRFIRQRAELLGSPMLELYSGGGEEAVPECSVDRERYRSWKKNYIKRPGSPDAPIWEIVAEYLSSVD